MPPRDLLVYLDPAAATDARIEVAARVARRFGCILIGHYADFVPPLADVDEEARVIVRTVEDRFMEAAQREGVVAEWQAGDEPDPDRLPVLARYADLSVLGQRDPSVLVEVEPVHLEDVVLSSGHPTLVVPYAGRFETLGERHILVAWNGSREAVRAVHDALPFLREARSVTVVAADLDEDGRKSLDLMAEHLARHEISTDLEPTTAADISVGDLLLSRTADLGSDLIVMGAYGHSRAREWILGGVTQHLLEQMTVPVLMSH
jgi:nucleotide-binding universal stress UspA family protein